MNWQAGWIKADAKAACTGKAARSEISCLHMGQQSVDGAGATYLLGLDKLRSDEGNRYFLFAADPPE